MNILLVDDDAELRDLYAQVFIQAGMKIVAANTAQAALDALEDSIPDVIILDILLPVHNGVSVMYEMQSYEDWANIPVIVLSSVPEEDIFPNSDLLQRLNVVSYCYKPATPPSRLLEIVKGIKNV